MKAEINDLSSLSKKLLESPVIDVTFGDKKLGTIHFHEVMRHAEYVPVDPSDGAETSLEMEEFEELEKEMRRAVGFYQCDQRDEDVRIWTVRADFAMNSIHLWYENF